MDFSTINAMIKKGESFDTCFKQFSSQIDSHPMVIAHENKIRQAIKKHKVAKLREMVNYYDIPSMSGKRKAELVEALVQADWNGLD